ncbi:MAG: M50 family metallopeptidase [Nitratireductor sp.]|nr:M50 family metallopeptidase [Nitratireductor sp.]
MQFLKNHWQMLLLTTLVYALWNTQVVFPLKILVVFLHELSHGLAAILTGGSIEWITLAPDESGLAYIRGGSRFAILTAGYLGSLLLGVLVLLAALKTSADRIVMGVFGATMILVAAFYIRDLFPLVFCIGTGLAMLASAWWLSHRANDVALRIIGLSSMIYVPYDIFSDTIARSELRSDARMLAEEFGGSTMLWGGIWLLLSIAVILLCLRYAFRESSNLWGQGAAATG